MDGEQRREALLQMLGDARNLYQDPHWPAGWE